MDDIELYINPIKLPLKTLHINDCIATRIIDTIYLKFISNKLYIIDSDTNERYLVTQDCIKIQISKPVASMWYNYIL